jgi:hypothetical protein
MVQVGFDFGRTQAAIHRSVAARRRHQFGAAKIHVRRTGAVVIVDCLGRARYHRDAENRHRLARLSWRQGRLPLGRIRNLRCQRAE